MAHRVSPQAEADLDDIWYYVAQESANVETANHFIDSITDRFFLLSRHPHLGRSRDEDLGISFRTFPVGEYLIVYCIEDGRFRRTEDAIEEALSLWEERERKRAEFLATLHDAKSSLARGDGRTITQESMRQLATEVKQRGRSRLATEQSNSH